MGKRGPKPKPIAEKKARKKLADAARYLRTRQKHLDRAKAYRIANRERLLVKQKEYREKNAEKIAAYRLINSDQQAAWRTNHREEAAQCTRDWRLRNPERVRKHRVDAYKNHPDRWSKFYYANIEKIKKRIAEWRKANHDRVLIYAENKRASKSGGKISIGLVKLLLEEQGGACPYCFRDLEFTGINLDHYIPLSRGGKHCDSNIQLTCPPCNSKKRAKDPVEFLCTLLAV